MSKSIKSSFNAMGYFYEIKGIGCRRFLKLKHKDSKKKKPDIRVIMMNPGFSEPIKSTDLNKWTATNPDMTQSYIMKLMMAFGFEYAIILNLSDIREKDSDMFYYKLGLCEGQKIKTSVFKAELSKESKELLNDLIPTIAAWGVSEVLTDIAKVVVDKYRDHLIGLRKEKSKNCTKFYHPLMRAEKGNGWVNQMIE